MHRQPEQGAAVLPTRSREDRSRLRGSRPMRCRGRTRPMARRLHVLLGTLPDSAGDSGASEVQVRHLYACLVVAAVPRRAEALAIASPRVQPTIATAAIIRRRRMQLRTYGCPQSAVPSIAALVLATGLAAATGVVQAQTLSPYSDFQAMTLADMDSLRVKLTYGGPQDYLLATLVIVKASAPASIARFTPYRREGFEYSNDDGPIGTSAASRQELKAIIDNVGSLPRVTDGGVDAKGYVSFALMSTAGGTTKVFESIVND